MERHDLRCRVPDGVDSRRPWRIDGCDATHAVFAMDLPWTKLDVVTVWQKAMNGEAAHGMIALSRAAGGQNLYAALAIPKVFQTKDGKLIEGIFHDETTIRRRWCVGRLDGLGWAEGVGGGSTGGAQRHRPGGDF